MKVRFLLDENLSPRLITALHRLDPAIDILRVGDEGTPPLGTDDPTILHYLAASRRMLVTANRSTIPAHLVEHYASGGPPHWGVLWLRSGANVNIIVRDLHLIWTASAAEEWRDRTDWVPF